jgi:hypothetical protein
MKGTIPGAVQRLSTSTVDSLLVSSQYRPRGQSTASVNKRIRGPAIEEDPEMRKTSNPALTATTLQSAQPSPFVVIERVIECVGVGVLILGVLLLGASYVVSLVHVVQGLPGISIPQQLFNLFNFAVIEGFGLVLLSGRGRLPYLSPKVLSSIVGSTFEAIPSSYKL